jgi:aminodeoxychorismate lyase
METKFAFWEGKFIRENQVAISPDNRSFRYGDGCFETIKVRDNEIKLLPYHWERLTQSLALLKFKIPDFFTIAYLETTIQQLVQKNYHQKSARVRLTISRGNGLYDNSNNQPSILLQSWALNPYQDQLNENGLVIEFFEPGRKSMDQFSNIKSNNYLLYVLAAIWAKEEKLNDAIILNCEGRVCDTTIANIWMIKSKEIFTPALSEACVMGTMRSFLLEKLNEKGFTVHETIISKNDLLTADEVFVSNAIYGIKWVKQIGNKDYSLYQSALIYKNLFDK